MTEATAAASGAAHWRLQTEANGIAWLIIDKANAAVNSLSREVMEELDAILTALDRTPPKALIVTSAKNGFIAGADIKGFVGIDSPETSVPDDPAGPAGGRQARWPAAASRSPRSTGSRSAAVSRSRWRAVTAWRPTTLR